MCATCDLQPVASQKRQDQEAAASLDLKKDKLKAIDKLLWSTKFAKASVPSAASDKPAGKVQAALKYLSSTSVWGQLGI